MRELTNNSVWLRLTAWLCLFASSLHGQADTPCQSKPKGHGNNKEVVDRAYEANLKTRSGDTNVLILAGLVADKKARRGEVMVERTAVGPNAPCEFTVIGETSDHGCEALLISFAKPSDVHRALQFIGAALGEPFDLGSPRFWAKGEPFVLSIVRTNGPPLRLKKLLLDRRAQRGKL